MEKKVKIVTVYVHKESITCECICALQDVTIGDYVQIFINNAPVDAEVKEIREIPLTEMTDAMYEMKTVIKKVNEHSKIPNLSRNTISMNELIHRNRAITIIGRGIAGKLVFSDSEVEAFNAEVGDTLFFASDEGVKFRTTILKIEDSNDPSECRIHIDAIEKNQATREFIEKNKLVYDFSGDDKKVTLKAYLQNEEECVIEDWITNIGAKAFERNRKVKKVVVKTTGLIIEPLAFAYNESIEEIIIEDERVGININSFDGCRKLNKLIMPLHLFYRRFELEEYYGNKFEIGFEYSNIVFIDGVAYTKDLETIICCLNEDIETYTAPFQTKYILNHAFKNCRKLRKFVGSPFMKECSMAVFEGCMNLEEVEYRFNDDYDIVFLYGNEYCDNAHTEVVKFKDNTSRTFYMAKNCKYINLPEAEDLLRDIQPENMNAENNRFLGDYYASTHNIKEAIKFYSVAARQGDDKSYQKLAEYVQNESLGQEYFPIDLFDYADRTYAIKPFFLMFSRDFPQYEHSDMTDSEIIAKYQDREKLLILLRDIYESSIFDTDLLNIVLMKLYDNTEELQDKDIKKWFLRCASKIGYFDNVLYWKDDLLDEILETEEDYREFAFSILDIKEYRTNERKEKLIKNMPECETKDSLVKAYNSNQNPGDSSVTLFEDFLLKAKETGDIFYQKCAVLSICGYVAKCWSNKSLVAKFRNILESFIHKYNEGFDVVANMILMYKQNMKKDISKSFYMQCAEKLFDLGSLYTNDFDNILAKNTQEKAKFFCKYPEFFDLSDKDSLIMKELNSTYFYIYGLPIQKPISAKTDPIMYLHYSPELINDELVLFLNPHEAVTYMKNKNMLIPNEFYKVPIGHILSIMETKGINEALVFPRTLNKKITKEYIESIYDWR